MLVDKWKIVTLGAALKISAAFILTLLTVLGGSAIPEAIVYNKTGPDGASKLILYNIFNVCKAPQSFIDDFLTHHSKMTKLEEVTCWQFPILGMFVILASFALVMAVLDIAFGFVADLSSIDFLVQFVAAFFVLGASVLALTSGVTFLEIYEADVAKGLHSDLERKADRIEYAIKFSRIIAAGALGLLDFFIFVAAGFTLFNQGDPDPDDPEGRSLYQWWQKKSTTTTRLGKSKTTQQQPPASASNQILPQSSEIKQFSTSQIMEEGSIGEVQGEQRKSWWPFSA